MKSINRLSEILAEKKIYNRQLAGIVGKSEETISRWVNNHRQPSLEDLDKIAEFLKLDIRELLHPSDWSESKVKPFQKKS